MCHEEIIVYKCRPAYVEIIARTGADFTNPRGKAVGVVVVVIVRLFRGSKVVGNSHMGYVVVGCI